MALKQQLTPNMIGAIDGAPAGTEGQKVETLLATPMGEINQNLIENTTPDGSILMGAPDGTVGVIREMKLGEVQYKQSRMPNITPDGYQLPVIKGEEGHIIHTVFTDVTRTKEVEFFLYRPLLQYVLPNKTGLAGVMMGGASGGNGVTRDGWLPPRKAPFGYTPIRREQPTS